MTIGSRIKHLRKKKNWTQTELGEKTNLSFSAMSLIEVDRNKPSSELIIKLSEIFEVSTDYLLTGKEGTSEISEDEREVLEAMRQDTAFKQVAIEVAKAKKKVIDYLRNYKVQRKNERLKA